MAVIFSFSAQNGDKSSGLSRTVTEVLIDVVKPQNRAEAFDSMHFFVRKAAHFTEYAILGVLWSLVLSTYPKLKASRGLIAFAASVIWAVLDEFHQSFVANRTPAIMDVCIDSSGALLAILIFSAIFWIAARRQKNLQ